MAKLNIVGLYCRYGDYFYLDTTNNELLTQAFKLGLCKRFNPKPNQTESYLIMLPHNAVSLPDGKPNKYISGLYKFSDGVYKIEWERTYYKCTVTESTAIIELWSSDSTGRALDGR